MLFNENDITIDLLYPGPGHGCRHVLRYDQIGYTRELDGDQLRKSQAAAYSEIESIVFDRFAAGEFCFEPPERQAAALAVLALPDETLIESVYVEDLFVRSLVRRELRRRGMMDEGICRIGEFGNDLAREQAVSLLKRKLRE